MGDTISKIEYKNLEFHEKIGEGGFGFVHRVTLKKPFNGFTEAAAKTVFEVQEQEVVIMGKLHHPHIVRLLGFCETGHVNTGIIVMEYAPNGSLHQYLSDDTKPLPFGLKRKWIIESAEAIGYLHRNNFLHRDIKAKNCLLSEGNILKLADFGLAREIVNSQTTSSMKGTYRYMAPEILEGNEQGRAVFSKPADIYGYGMLILEIWTRKQPFDEMEWQKVVFEVGNGKRPDIPADCPPRLSDILKRCWDADPKKRPPIAYIIHVLGWVMVRKIHPQNPLCSLSASRIDCCPNGDLVVGGDGNQLYMLDSEGRYKMTLIPHRTDNPIKNVCGIAVSPQGDVMVIDSMIYVRVFAGNGEYRQRFCTITADDSQATNSVNLACITIDREGKVLVGDSMRNLITIHKCPNGELVERIQCPALSINSHMVINSKRQILIHSTQDESFTTVSAIDYSGNKIFTFTPRICNSIGNAIGRRMLEGGIVCDAMDNIYLALKDYGRKETGHIYKYSPTGAYLQCIAKELWSDDLSIKPDGSLVVANVDSVLIYHESEANPKVDNFVSI